MEENLISPFTVTHLLQHTLRSLCINNEDSHWVYAVFWRILPRNFPPPKWDAQGGAYDRSRGNRRNWILVWEDGFCNFAASSNAEISSSDFQPFQGLQPELFFKMSHEIYNYGEGLIGKVAADHSHKWIHKDPCEQEINFLSTWHNLVDSQPRTWEAQFQSGIKTIALIAVREGVIQLGAMQKVVEDLSYIVTLRKKLSLIESIPGVLLPHPSYSGYCLPYQLAMNPPNQDYSYDNHLNQQMISPLMMKITPSMSSLNTLLSKLPSVVPPPAPPSNYAESQCQLTVSPSGPTPPPQLMAKEEKEVGDNNSSASTSSYHQQPFYYHQDLSIVSSTLPDKGLI